MSDNIPTGPVSHGFRGVQVSLFASSGAWWVEVQPCPRSAAERLARPWRFIARVPFLGIEGPYTYQGFVACLATLAAQLSAGDYDSVEQLRSL